MLATLEILLPVFGLIFAGFACRRRDVLGPNSASELNRFVVWLALPALLFDTMARATWQQLYQPGFVATFSIGCVSVFLLILVIRMLSGRHLADASVDAIAASYPNTGYIGFPLGLIAFGSASLTPTRNSLPAKRWKSSSSATRSRATRWPSACLGRAAWLAL